MEQKPEAVRRLQYALEALLQESRDPEEQVLIWEAVAETLRETAQALEIQAFLLRRRALRDLPADPPATS